MGQEESIQLIDDPSTGGLLGRVTSPRHRSEDFREWLKTKPEMTFRLRSPKPEFAAISWLKSAYLSVVSLLGPIAGYRYAESKSLALVRRQIMRSDSDLLRNFSLRCPDSSLDHGITLARLPIACWSVKLGDRVVLLPRGDDAFFYKSLEALRKRVGAGSIEVTGSPTWHLLRFGFLPAASLELKDSADVRAKHGVSTLFGTPMKVATPEFVGAGVCADHQGRQVTVLFTSGEDPRSIPS